MDIGGETPGPVRPPQRFPNLKVSGYRETSPPDEGYNCFAFAAGDTARWWDQIHYWPPGIPIEESVLGFVRVYQTLGFECCDDGSLERGFEKIAIYAIGQEATHAARQLPTGIWISKLGPDEDIEHSLEGLEGDFYGKVARFMKRARPTQSTIPAPGSLL